MSFIATRLMFSRFLAHKATGWAALVLFGVVAGFAWRYDYVTDQLVACRATEPTPATREFADVLREQNKEELKAALDALDAADNPCLGWVYDPDGETGDSTMRSPEEEE